MKGGVQSVTTSITQTTSPIPDVTDATLVSKNDPMLNFWLQLASISYATQELFLGSTVLEETMLRDNRTITGQPSFLDINFGDHVDSTTFSWGDVLKGIEEMSHNVTAALLTLSLGTMSAECSFDQQVVVYQYTPFALWVPYGVSNFALLSSYDLTFSPLCFIGGLGHRSHFTRGCRRDNGEK